MQDATTLTTHVSDLIGDAGERRAERGRRDLSEEDGDLRVQRMISTRRTQGREGGRTTPHAPCTPNWMQNAPAASALNDDGRIHSGMNASAADAVG